MAAGVRVEEGFNDSGNAVPFLPLGKCWTVGRLPGQFLRRTELIKRLLRLSDEPTSWCLEPLQGSRTSSLPPETTLWSERGAEEVGEEARFHLLAFPVVSAVCSHWTVGLPLWQDERACAFGWRCRLGLAWMHPLVVFSLCGCLQRLPVWAPLSNSSFHLSTHAPFTGRFRCCEGPIASLVSLVLATFQRLFARRRCWYCLPYENFQVCFDPVRPLHCTRAVYSSSLMHSDVRSSAHSASTVSSVACISSFCPIHPFTTNSFSATFPSPKHSCATVHVPIIPRISRTTLYTRQNEVWYSLCPAMTRASIDNGIMHALDQHIAVRTVVGRSGTSVVVVTGIWGALGRSTNRAVPGGTPDWRSLFSEGAPQLEPLKPTPAANEALAALDVIQSMVAPFTNTVPGGIGDRTNELAALAPISGNARRTKGPPRTATAVASAPSSGCRSTAGGPGAPIALIGPAQPTTPALAALAAALQPACEVGVGGSCIFLSSPLCTKWVQKQ